jgi:aspartyl-tRNA(Asn)/glutamyl-tRNA(Gln) amidotransferase subunit B
MTASLPHPDYEVVIGIEVHCQLRTASKLFSPAPVRYGEEPNHSVHPVCLALPGVLPVLNERAVEYAVRAALATQCAVHLHSVFARKNYFYPDLPKGYQISQFEEPIATGGFVDVPLGENGVARIERIRLTRIHMEEDAGKLVHDSAVAGDDGTHVDLNRAGVPLLEIVSEPDLRSPAAAVAYLRALRSILRYIDVTDADMERGNFKCDVNVSLRRHGSTELGVRTELKNLNSFRFIEAAIEAEIERQAEILDDGGEVVQATMAFDPLSGRTRMLRLKENSDDYRYFPDPDLVPMVLDPALIERVRELLPELADARAARFERDHEIAAADARTLTESRELAEFFEAAVAMFPQGKTLANWILRDVLRALNEAELEIEQSKLTPTALAALLRLVADGVTTAKGAQGLIPDLVRVGGDPASLVKDRGREAVSDTGVLEAAVEAVLAASAEDVERYRGGEKKVLNFLMGQVMKQTQGKADPGAVRGLLAKRLDEEGGS